MTAPTRTFRLSPETVKKVEAAYEASNFHSYDEFFGVLCDHYAATHRSASTRSPSP